MLHEINYHDSVLFSTFSVINKLATSTTYAATREPELASLTAVSLLKERHLESQGREK